jgi:hypothetical protein
MKRAIVLGAALAALGAGTQACGPAEPAEEEIAATEDPLRGLSGSSCEVLDRATTQVFHATLVLGTVTIACEAAVVVTTGGIATPACLVPLAGTGAAALAGLLSRGAHMMLCSGNRRVTVESRATADYCPSGARRTCGNDTWDDVRERKANACNRTRGCSTTTPCADILARITAGSQCLTARDRVTDVCCGGHMDDAHQDEWNRVLGTMRECQRLSTALGCGR